jgi:ribosomal peptide maturation radical SAM protein 1
LQREGIRTRCFYPNLEFAREVGPVRYERYGTYDSCFSQWVFSQSLFGRFEPPASVGPPDFLEFARQQGVGPAQLDELLRVSELVPRFFDWCLDAVAWDQVRVVGFTTTLLQTVPSLALAKHLKERYPHLQVLLGGAGCHGIMGKAVHRNFPFVDGVVDGEADLTIGPIVNALLAGREPAGIPGLTWRGAAGVSSTEPSEPCGLGDYPVPVYDDYFTQAGPWLRELTAAVRVPFEASRGCWWALRSQCKFCGLNGKTLAQRTRSVEDVINELQQHRRRHNASFFFAVDNIIAPTHVTRLPQALRTHLPGAELFFEARVVMPRRHLRGIAAAGIRHLQPGVESLVPEVLEMVDKGTTPIINVCFLRRCAEFDIQPYWNLLHGFPGEQREWYDQLLLRLPLLHHLPPPDVVRFSLQRFSPYFDDAERYQIRVTGSVPGSRYVWNLPEAEVRDLSFDLAFELPQTWDVEALTSELQAAIQSWKSSKAVLTARIAAAHEVAIHDTRGGRLSALLPPDLSWLLRALEKPTTAAQLARMLVESGLGDDSTEAAVDRVAQGVKELADRGLVYAERGQYVALTIPEHAGFWLGEPDDEDDSPAARLAGTLYQIDGVV